MKVVYTDEALENLAGILDYIAAHYPAIYDAFQIRLQSVVDRGDVHSSEKRFDVPLNTTSVDQERARLFC